MSFLLLFFVAVPLAVILIVGAIMGVKSLGGFRFGHVTLTCPHCHKETPAQLGKCQQCGQPFS